jgi:uncharacterized membrane protein
VSEASPLGSPPPGRLRLDSIDAVRGAVMVIMMLDHMRDFTHPTGFMGDPLDPATTTPILYFTRWITHLCAPTFVFLAGLSAGLLRLRGKPVGDLGRFLWTRGLWLVFLELTLVRTLVSFNLHLSMLAFLQVIWVIGIGMIALSLLVRLPSRAVLAIGLAICAGHNLLDQVQVTPWMGPQSAVPSVSAKLWMLFHQTGFFPVAGFPSPIVIAIYPILPWIGVIAFGYGFAEVYGWAPDRRRRLLVGLAIGMAAAFVALRYVNAYGDPLHWSAQADAVKTAMSFFNVQKYGPSLLFLLVTLAPSVLCLGLLDGRTLASGPGGWLVTFGRVPLFFYLLQWIAAHLSGIAVALALGHSVAPYFMNMVEMFMLKEPPAMGGPLWGTYLCWTFWTIVLYFPCRWFARVKATRRDWWISYL